MHITACTSPHARVADANLRVSCFTLFAPFLNAAHFAMCVALTALMRVSFSPHSGCEEARLRGIASRANERPSAVREGWTKVARSAG